LRVPPDGEAKEEEREEAGGGVESHAEPVRVVLVVIEAKSGLMEDSE
jgi:hypothetical protein